MGSLIGTIATSVASAFEFDLNGISEKLSPPPKVVTHNSLSFMWPHDPPTYNVGIYELEFCEEKSFLYFIVEDYD